MNDILAILETAAGEIRALRQQVESDRLMRQNIALRLTIHQLRHGTLDYKDADAALWTRILQLFEDGRLVISSSAEIYLDRREVHTAEEIMSV